jgi:hypothetical protein
MVRKWTEGGGGGEKREKQARRVAEFQREGYHISTVPVKEYLEVIGGAGVRGERIELATSAVTA